MELIGMAKPPKGHQNLIVTLCEFINDENGPSRRALPEPNINDGDEYSLQPDVLVVDMYEEINLVAIELERKANIKFALKKAEKYIAEESVEECFIFQYKPQGFADYEVTKIYRVDKKGIHENETESNVLEIDFSGFLN